LKEGVAGTLDYLIFTILISRPGWLIYSLDEDSHGEYHKMRKMKTGIKTWRVLDSKY
jgi:hypothetical protein